MPAKTFQERYITDRAGRQTHVILPMEIYKRIRPLLEDDDFTVVAALDWNAPEMDAYDDL
jgi:hypothetical protein